MDISKVEQYSSRWRTMFEGANRRCVVHRAANDHTVSRDPRTLHNLKAMEKTCPVFSYFDGLQQDIKPYMRKLLTGWMLEVHKSDVTFAIGSVV